MHQLINKPLVAVAGPSTWSFDRSRPKTAVCVKGVKFGSNLQQAQAGRDIRDYTAKHVECFADLFFKQHVSVLPGSIDSGRVLDEKTFEVTLWNTGMQDTQLQSVSVSGFEGVALNLQLPEVLPRLQQKTYEVTVHADGPATIAASALFHFDNCSDSKLSISGQRLLLWNYRPDWSNGMEHEFEYLTDVVKAHDGTEDRRALRGKPRQRYTHSYLLHADEMREAMQKLRGFQFGEWSLPQWRKETIGQFAQGAGSIEIKQSERFTQVGEYLYFSNSTSSQVVQVSDVVGDTIMLSKVLRDDFYSVTPLSYICMPSQATNVSRCGSLSSLSLSFEVDAAKDSEFHSEPITDTYKELPVWLERPNWISEPEHAFELDLTTIDFEIGRKFLDKKSASETVQFVFTMLNEDEIQKSINFMAGVEGRLNDFYMPSFRDDLKLVQPLLEGRKTLYVKACGYGTSTHPVSPDLYIKRMDGTVDLAEVEKVEQMGDIELLTLTAPIAALDVNDVDQICILRKGRFESDAFKFNYKTPHVADLTKTFRCTH
ncbi:hypothetical protein P3547_19945 [Vibrio parahaemolyticus]|nr:hypothetical protein [Vibrio parahaemolyticus]